MAIDVRLTAYARGQFIRKVNDMIKDQDEYRGLENKLEEIRKRIETKTQEFEQEARDSRSHATNEADFQRMIQEIKQRAKEAIDPIFWEMNRVKDQIKDETTRLFAKLLAEMADDELKEIHGLLREYGVQNLHQDEMGSRGRLGRGYVLSLHFKVEKDAFKKLRRKLETTPYQKVELFLQEL